MLAELAFLRENDGDKVRKELNDKFEAERQRFNDTKKDLNATILDLNNQLNQAKMVFFSLMNTISQDVNGLKMRLQSAQAQIDDQERLNLKDVVDDLKTSLAAKEQELALAKRNIDKYKKKLAVCHSLLTMKSLGCQ